MFAVDQPLFQHVRLVTASGDLLRHHGFRNHSRTTLTNDLCRRQPPTADHGQKEPARKRIKMHRSGPRWRLDQRPDRPKTPPRIHHRLR